MTASATQRRLQDNIQRVRTQIDESCARAGREPQSVRLVAVTKGVDVNLIRLTLEAGLTDLGESRVQALTQRASMIQEAIRRQRLLEDGGLLPAPRWHLVGHLQRNKIKPALEWCDCIHSLDSLRLAEDLDGEAERRGRPIDVLLQVNVADDRNKHGVAVGAVDVLVDQMRRLQHLRLVGLMGMAPLVDDPEQARPVFARLKDIFEELRTAERVPETCCELSMGMTHDYAVAVEEGATMVRIGSALFGGLAAAGS